MAAKPKPSLTTPFSEPTGPEEVAAVEEFGSPLRVLRIYFASGAYRECHWEDYHEKVNSLAAVAKAFGVHERTAAGWKAQTMPVAADGKYILPAIRQWRLHQSNPEDWLFTGSRSLKRASASGDLTRGILRWIRHELKQAVSNARDDFLAQLDEIDTSDRKAVGKLFTASLARHLDGYQLSDAEIEELLFEAWELI